MTEKEIFDYFIKNGLTVAGTCGLMGNIFAESHLQPNNLQDSYNKKFGMSDQEYTDAVDLGLYKDFVSDKSGWGLVQLTHWSRKQKFYNLVKKRGVSIADPLIQLDFLMMELKSSFKAVYKVLTTTTSVQVASDTVLTQFEKPADQSTAVKTKRLQYSEGYFKKYGTTTTVIKPSNKTTESKGSFSINKDYPCNKSNYGKARPLTDIKWIVVHYTGNKTDTALANVKYFQGADRKASAHWFIDQGNVIYESVAPGYVAWSVGKKYGEARYWGVATNQTTVNIELCSTNGAIAQKTLENAIVFIRYLMAEYNIDINHVIRHKDSSGKNCPGWTLSNDLDFADFKNKIQKNPTQKMDNRKVQVTATPSLNIRSGPSTSYGLIGKLYKGEIIEVCEEKNGFLRLKGMDSWVCASYVKEVR